MVQLIEIGSPAFDLVVEAAAIGGFQAGVKFAKGQTDDFIDQEEAMKRLKIGPTNHAKMKAMRDAKELVFKKNGRKFLYSAKSILNWMGK